MNNMGGIFNAIVDIGFFIGNGLNFWYYCMLSKKSFKSNIKTIIFFGIVWFLSALVILFHFINT